MRRIDDVNMFVRLRAIQTMHNLIESSTKNLGKDCESIPNSNSGYFECLLPDQYFDAFDKVSEKISESATNVSMSAVKCISSFLNNNRYIERLKHINDNVTMKRDVLEDMRLKLKNLIADLIDKTDTSEEVDFKIAKYDLSWEKY